MCIRLLLYLMFTLLSHFHTVEVTPGDLKEFIFKQSVTVNLLELAISGLPCSGKDELLHHMLELGTSTTQARLSVEGPSPNNSGLDVYEGILCRNEVNGSHAWVESDKEETHIHTLATALAHALARMHWCPFLVQDESGSMVFEDPSVNEHFQITFTRLQRLVTKLESEGSMEQLITSSLTLLNLVNVGVNKAAFEILAILGSRCKNIILLNMLNMERETPERFNKPPDLSDPVLYGKRYHPRKDGEKVMKLHSSLYYYMQHIIAAGGYEQKGNTILVGTHKDRLSHGDFKQRKKFLELAIMGHAAEIGTTDAICPDMECINARDPDDCKRLQERIVKLIHHKKRFEYKVPITHLFFRCYLYNMKKLFISRKELVKEAHKCGMRDEEDIEKFLVVFNDCGSIFYSADGEFPLLKEYVILDPFQFIQALDRLYYVDLMSLHDKPELFRTLQNTHLGFLSDKLALELWPGEGEGGMTEAQFLLHILKDLKVIVQIDRILPRPTEETKTTPFCDEGQHCYFMPSLRPDFDTTEPKLDSNSLVVVYNVAMIPFHLQSDIVLYLQSQVGKEITYDPKPFYNTVCFKWCDPKEQCEANITVRFRMEQIEVSIKFSKQAPRMSLVTHLFSALKTACVHLLQQLSSQIKGFKYDLAIVCPLSNGGSSHSKLTPTSQRKAHFITFNPLATKETSFFCDVCKTSVPSDQLPWARLLWTQVAYKGTSQQAVHPDGKSCAPFSHEL